MVADIMTNALPAPRFRKMLSIDSATNFAAQNKEADEVVLHCRVYVVSLKALTHVLYSKGNDKKNTMRRPRGGH